MEMLTNSLLTDEGFLNQACINELEAALKNMPKDYERLAEDPEWSVKRWTSRKDITSALAKWAIRQSPYPCPDNLEKVVNYLDVCIRQSVPWDGANLAQLSLCDVNKLLDDILLGTSIFDAWNVSRKESGQTKFVTAFSKSDPDTDFIDLGALLRNVCIEIRDERRTNDLFDKKFEEKMEQERN